MTGLLAGGVFGAGSGSDVAELRQLVDEIGKKSAADRVGTRGLPDTFDSALWHNLTEAGLTRLVAPPDPDAGPAEYAVILQGIARHSGAVPLAENDLLAAWLADQAGISLSDGPLTVAYAASPTVSSSHIIGKSRDVPWTRCATRIVLATQHGEELLIGVAEPHELTITDRCNSAGEPRDEIAFELPAERFTAVDPRCQQEYRRRGAWARCVQVLGALDAAALLAVEHTRNREQFGRPLAAFQSVQHALAQMAGEIERFRATVTLAVMAANDLGFDCKETAFAVSVAKVVGAQVVPTVSAVSHQLHGAIGTTIEHPLWLSITRAQCWIREFGSRSSHAVNLADHLSPAHDPWDTLLQRTTE